MLAARIPTKTEVIPPSLLDDDSKLVPMTAQHTITSATDTVSTWAYPFKMTVGFMEGRLRSMKSIPSPSKPATITATMVRLSGENPSSYLDAAPETIKNLTTKKAMTTP